GVRCKPRDGCNFARPGTVLMRGVVDERSVRRARWMECVQKGDREAYRARLDDVGPPLLAFLRRRVADPHEVEDIHQETLIALHRARHTYDPARPLEPWLFAIARNVAAEHNRRSLARASWEVLLETPPEAPCRMPSSPPSARAAPSMAAPDRPHGSTASW